MFKRLINFLNRTQGNNEEPGNDYVLPDSTLEEINAMRDDYKSMVKPGDVLRYPPAVRGFPAKIPGHVILLDYQQDMISAIKRELCIRDSEFDALVMPMLIKFADFVHLFPASENHHHRGSSGLLRHSLEVCFHSIRKAKNIEFDSASVPVEKSNRVLAWRLAICTGGLLHDIGKPFTDFEVWDGSGKEHWPPGRTPVHEWATQADVERYFLIWKQGRHLQHHSSTTAMMMDIIPHALHNFILKEGNDIFNELTAALAYSSDRNDENDKDMVDVKNKILRIIKASDSASTLHDLKRFGGDAVRATQSGVPAVQRVVDAMRVLLKKGTWIPNKPGHPVWVTTQGIFIVWGTAVEDITRTVQKTGTVIPQSANSLADLMLDSRLCVPCVNEKQDSAYWLIAPHKMNDKSSRESEKPKVSFSCLRLIAEEILFVDVMVPLPVSCRIRVDNHWKEFRSDSKSSTKPVAESRPYIGTSPPPEGALPVDVNPDILKGGSITQGEEEEILGTKFGAGVPITAENAPELLLHLNLLTKEQLDKINERRSQKNASAEIEHEQATATLDEYVHGSDVEQDQFNGQEYIPSDAPPDIPQPPIEAYFDDVPKLRIKKQIDERQASLPFEQGDSEQSEAVTPFSSEPNFISGQKISIRDALARQEIVDLDRAGEEKLSLLKNNTDPTLSTPDKQNTNETQVKTSDGDRSESDSSGEYQQYVDPDFGYKDSHLPIEADSNDAEYQPYTHDIQSQLFRNGSESARSMLRDYVLNNVDSLFNDNGHLIVCLPSDTIENTHDEMVKSGWVWHPFMQKSEKFYTYRSSMCFYLHKGLADDIDQISDGRYRKSISSASMDNFEINKEHAYRSLALNSTLKETQDKKLVFALSPSTKKKLAAELNVDFSQFKQFLIDEFEVSTRANVDYILADEKITQYMVTENE